MKLPTVSIIGRPNTGKSTLFNRLVGRRKAIVTDVPGTTRDHIAHKIETEKMDYLLVDTGGMGGGTEDLDLEDDVERQSQLALEQSDLILFTVNSREDLTASDFAIAEMLRKSTKKHVPIVIVLTKCDDPTVTESLLPQYYSLAVSDTIVPISAPHNMGLDELQDAIADTLKTLHFEKQPKLQEGEDIPKIAIIGKPNVGKSSIINALMSDPQREKSPLLVSDIAGTTRDATDTEIRYNDQPYIFVDTAGIKKRASTDKGIETFSYFRSVRALQEADIAVLVLNALEPVSKQDKRIAGLAIEEGKGLIILVNKMDSLPEDISQRDVLDRARIELPYCKYAQFIGCSAHTKKGLLHVFNAIEAVQRSRVRRIPTKQLMDWYRDAIMHQPLGQLSKSKQIVQADEVPPTFVLFLKHPERVQVTQLRYLENRLRETFDFDGTPVRWITKEG